MSRTGTRWQRKGPHTETGIPAPRMFNWIFPQQTFLSKWIAPILDFLRRVRNVSSGRPNAFSRFNGETVRRLAHTCLTANDVKTKTAGMAGSERRVFLFSHLVHHRIPQVTALNSTSLCGLRRVLFALAWVFLGKWIFLPHSKKWLPVAGDRSRVHPATCLKSAGTFSSSPVALNSFAADHFRAFGHFQDPRDVLVPDHIDTKRQNERIDSLVSPEGEKKK